LKTSIHYLPELKQKELEHICELVTEEMQPAFVILFGSYARNTWAEEVTQEEGINLEFKSDYDVLVITPEDLNRETNMQWMKVRQKISSISFSTHVSIIQHSTSYINRELKAGGYFFSDVIKEGVVLYHDGSTLLLQPGDTDLAEVKKRAEEELEYWVEKGNNFLKLSKLSSNEGMIKEGVFVLHQATESYYTAALLYLTGYKGKLHDIEELSHKACKLIPDFKQVFPKETKEQKDRFDLLKRAYIDSRYKKSYAITKEDLQYLSERVMVLKGLVEKVCM